MSKETFTFQAEVSRLLDIVARSLYSHEEIFLRELISNASDACDRLRYEAQTAPALLEGGGDFRIGLTVDKEARTIAISDNGIGMGREDLVETLGTIARSGTQAFVEKLGGSGGEAALIGQFGVGFYSAFMVAETVEVLTRKAGEAAAWLWVSDGKGTFTIEAAQRDGRGTTVTLHLRKDAGDFLERARIETIVRRYSDHIAIPIVFGDDQDAKPLNAASALWTRPRAEVTEEQYRDFYRHVAHAFDEPWLTLHNKAEGVLSYTNLLFVPSTRPFDLFEPERKPRLKLYVKRVFVTDDCAGLLPGYLRFLRGVVDSEDLSLNISREMLQHDPKLARIRAGLVKRTLGELRKKADADAAAYATFWEAFGAVLKEGIHEDFENREALLDLARFRSTAVEGWTTLAAYLERMREGQDAIYTIAGDNSATLARSPQIEGFKAKGVEVLLLTDAVDEFWPATVDRYKDTPFRSVTRADVDLSAVKAAPDAPAAERPGPEEGGDLDTLVAAFKLALGEAVSDVRLSKRLTESPVCLVAGEGGMDLRLERLLKRHNQLGDGFAVPRVLEVNPGHVLIRRLGAMANAGGPAAEEVAEAARLLLDQARILEGEPVADPAAFARRLGAVMAKGLA